jgi:hypothetical protein
MKRTKVRRKSFLWFATLGIAPLALAGAYSFKKTEVVSVRKHEEMSVPRHKFPGNAPPTPADYAYDISIRLNCRIDVDRYESAMDYLPSTLRAGNPAEISVEKHTIYAQAPGADDVKLNLVRSYRSLGTGCPGGAAPPPGV